LTLTPPTPPLSRQQMRAQMRTQLLQRLNPAALPRRQRRLLARTLIQQWRPKLTAVPET